MTSAPFHYRGTLSSSKSLLNRLLVIGSYDEQFQVLGESTAEDVAKMRSALAAFSRGEPCDCGAAGTTLRFLALRASRKPGVHHLTGSLRLFERPQAELGRVLERLGCETVFGPQRLTIRSQGWKVNDDPLVIDRSVSSQFASAVFLNTWDLPRDLKVELSGDAVSESYFQMTLALLKEVGLVIREDGPGRFTIPAGQKLQPNSVRAEIDVSSAFAVAALAAARGGEAIFQHWPVASLQPDAIFPRILSQMGCDVEISGSELKVARIAAVPLKAVNVDLRESPDLFPVLSVLAGLAIGTSRLAGAPHLVFKESDRIEKSKELLKKMHRRVNAIEGGLEIDGSTRVEKTSFVYETDHDHRLAMAGAVARAAGFRVEIANPHVVDKSFPEFWSIVSRGGLES